VAAELRVTKGPNAGQTIPLVGKQFLIGRERDCDLRPDSELISRHHCVLRQDDYTVRIRDLGSRNGTYVNARQIHGEVILGDGDLIFIGELTLQLTIQHDAPSLTPGIDRALEETQHTSLANTGVYEGDTASATKKNSPQAEETVNENPPDSAQSTPENQSPLSELPEFD